MDRNVRPDSHSIGYQETDSATREQGGGARRLTLDNIWAGWNWYLTTALGT
jgi:hypothetical protein